jgi:flagellar basal-body rod protein FlgB
MDAIQGMLDFQAEALRLRGERQRVLASNIANADTPGYKARDFDFGKALAEATSGAGPAPGSLNATDPKHLGSKGAGVSTVSLAYRVPGQASLDGNTVEIDAERAKFAENTVRYEASLKFLGGHLKSLLTAIQGQ